jgi:hypothetical protein
MQGRKLEGDGCATYGNCLGESSLFRRTWNRRDGRAGVRAVYYRINLDKSVFRDKSPTFLST